MNTLFKIIFAGLFATVISCSGNPIVEIPSLHKLCQQAVKKDFDKKVDRAFVIVKKDNNSENDIQELQEILDYNTYLQNDMYIQTNIQLPSLVHSVGNNVDNYGSTPLHYSAGHNTDTITAQLLAAGANVHAQNNDGSTPLHYSAINNADKTTAQLLAAGASVNTQNNNGRTPLHCSARENAEKTMALLLAAGADIHARDNNGNTPLHSSVIKNAEKTTAQLLAAGARV